MTLSPNTPILFIIFRYHTVDYLLKMSDILKIEYDLTLTLTALPPPSKLRCCQACHHCPQGCGHAAALAVGEPAAAAALGQRCPLCFPCCRRRCAAAAAITLPLPPPCCRRGAAATATLPLPCTATATAKPPLRFPQQFCR